MNDLIKWLKCLFARFQNWLGGASLGGLAITIVYLWERFSGKAMSNIWYSLIFIVFFILASSFFVWKDEHKKVEQLEKEKDKNTPKLSAEIRSIAISKYGQNNESSMVVLYATIKNSGSPSIVDHFGILIKTDGQELLGLTVSLLNRPSRYALLMPHNEHIKLTREDYLPTKGLQSPIPCGGSIVGFYSAVISNVKKEDIPPNSIVIFIFQDVVGKDYGVTQVLKDIPYAILGDPILTMGY